MLGGPGVRRGRHRVQRGIIDIAGHQLADPAVQGRGEEHPLAARGRLVEDAGDRGHEAQVGHVVRLVEHGDLDVGEREGTPLEQVDESARRRHDDVGVAHAGNLPADRHTAVDRGDAHADAAAQRRERVGDLLGEFAGRDEDQAAGCLLAPPVRGGREPGQHRKAEGQRLARPGLGAAEHVAAGQRIGKRPGLDGERLVDVTRRERPDQPGVQAEFGERGRRRLRCRGGGIQGQIKLGMRFNAPRPGCPGLLGRGRTAALGGALAASAVAIGRRARTPGTVGHAENSIGGSGVACSTDVNDNDRTADSAGLLAQRPAGCSPAERRRRSPPCVQGYQSGVVFPIASGFTPSPSRMASPAPSPPGSGHGRPVTSRRMASSSAVRCGPVTP